MSTFPVQGTRIILMFGEYDSRMEPARSAAVYPQKLQQKAMMIGLNSLAIMTSVLFLSKHCLFTFHVGAASCRSNMGQNQNTDKLQR